MVDSDKLDRWRGALWGLFVGDALAMPVHWYYDVAALQRDSGVVRDFEAPRGFRHARSDLEVIGRILSPACYIEHSFPGVLYLAARYSDNFETALVANTNLGGDNCHRGAVLGALLGAALGYQAIPERWIRGLRSRVELEQEIDSFLAKCQP